MGQATLALTTRRSLVAHSVAAAATITATASLALALPSGGPAHPDAGLIRLGIELDTAWANEAALHCAMKGHWTLDNEHMIERVADVSRAIVDRILAVPARTLDGFRIKAKAVSWCYDGDPITFTDDGATSEHLMASIVNDLLAVMPSMVV